MEEKHPVGRPKKEVEIKEISEQVLVDLSTLKLASDTLKKEIERLGNLKVNLEAEVNSLEFKKENTAKFDKVDVQKQAYDEEQRLNKKRDEIASRSDAVDRRELSFKDRIKVIEGRELAFLDLEEKRKTLMEERSNFFKYKYTIERELEKAKIVIEEAKAIETDFTVKEGALRAREIALQKKEKYWNDIIGKLEYDKEEFEIYKQNALRPVEVKNG